MLVEKNGVQYNITNQAQIDAFLSDGWTEVTKATTKKVAEEPTVKPTEEKPVKAEKKAKATK